jgi:hypothetical protein
VQDNRIKYLLILLRKKINKNNIVLECAYGKTWSEVYINFDLFIKLNKSHL